MTPQDERAFEPIQLGIDWKRRDGSIAQNVVRDETQSADGLFALIDDEGRQYAIDGRFFRGQEDGYDLVEPLKHPAPQPATQEPSELRIEAGKFYKNRKGEKIGPMKRNDNPQMQPDTYPWIATERGGSIEHYKKNGGWHWEDAEQSGYDLISEWPSEPQPAEASVELPTDYKLCDDPDAVLTADGEFQATTCYPNGWINIPADFAYGGKTIREALQIIPGLRFRRRVPAPASESVPSVEQPKYWMQSMIEMQRKLGEQQTELAELRRANAELLALDARRSKYVDNAQVLAVKLMGENCDLVRERDKLKSEASDLADMLFESCLTLAGMSNYDAVKELVRERDTLRKELAEVNAECAVKGQQIAGLAAYLAAIKAPAPQEDWRELTKGDTYSGPGQVRDSESGNWINANIAIVNDSPLSNYPFVARPENAISYCGYKQARVRAAEGGQS